MKIKMWQAAAVLSLAGAVALAALPPARQDAPGVVHAAPNDTVTPASDAETLVYRIGAAQLDMIRAQVLPLVALPAGGMLSGRLVYDDDVTARISVGFAGRVTRIRVAAGDHVKAGQALADIDSPDLGSAVSDLAKARADEAHKHAILERLRSLASGEAIAARELEAAQADFSQAAAETRRAEQHMRSFNPHGLPVHGQLVTLTSPFDGVVTERNVTPMLEVAPGMAAPLFVLTDPKRLWLLLDVPERDLSDVKAGAKVDVESDAYPGEHFHATIAQRGELVDPNTRRVTVRARLENPAAKLLPEMFVRASLLQDHGRAVRVPNSALVNRGINQYVFVQTSPGQFRRRQVQVAVSASQFSYVGAGLSGGEEVVTTGALLLDAEMGARAANKP